MNDLNKSIYKIGSDTAFSILARSNELLKKGNDVINLGIGQPDFPTPPNIINAAIKAIKDGHHGYSPSAGIVELREAIAEDFFKRTKVQISPSEILVTPGGKAVIFYTLLMFGKTDAEIIYPDPGFIAYKSMIDYTGSKAVPLAHRMENNFSFDTDELLSLINDKTKLIIINSPANPTGGIVPFKELEKLAKGLAKFPGVYILSDEIYSRIIFDGNNHISLMSFPEIRDRVIVLDGWSKTFAMTGWRLGYGVFPKRIFEYAEKLAINCHSCVNLPTQFAGIEALAGKQNYVKKMVEKFLKRRNFLVENLNLIPGIHCIEPKGAFYVFPKIKKNNLTSKEISNSLLEKKFLATVPGSSFGKNGEGFIRISYANKLENLKKSIKLIKEFISE